MARGVKRFTLEHDKEFVGPGNWTVWITVAGKWKCLGRVCRSAAGKWQVRGYPKYEFSTRASAANSIVDAWELSNQSRKAETKKSPKQEPKPKPKRERNESFMGYFNRVFHRVHTREEPVVIDPEKYDRVKNLLALATSPYYGEAVAAEAKARELAEAYGFPENVKQELWEHRLRL